MSLNWSRREFLHVLESLTAVGLFSDVAPALTLVRDGKTYLLESGSGQSVPGAAFNGLNNVPNTSYALQTMSNFVDSGIQSLNAAAAANMQYMIRQATSGYNGPTISADYGRARPYMPEQEQELELEVPSPKDQPTNRMNFSPQTGLFDNIPVGIPGLFDNIPLDID